MTQQEFKNLSTEWEELNHQYDEIIRNGFNGTTTLDIPTDILKSMQQRLYDIETTWFSVIEKGLL